MAATALLKFTQDLNVGADGQAFSGEIGTLVTVGNSDNTDVVSWTLDLVYADPAGGTPVLSPYATGDSNTPVAQFLPDVRRSYRWVLKVWSVINQVGPPDDVDIRVFTVPELNGVIIPPIQIWPEPLPDPASGLPGAKPNEMNFSGQSGGWAGGTDGDGLLNDTLSKLFVKSSRELYVDRYSPILFDAQNGSRSLPFIQIQSALDVISDSADDSAWTIYLSPGPYEESLVIPAQRKIAIIGSDYTTTTLNVSSHGSIVWSLSGSSYLAFKNIRADSISVADGPNVSPNTGTLYLENASFGSVSSATYSFDLIGTGPNTFIEHAVVTGRLAVDGIDHLTEAVCADFAAYDSLFSGSSIDISGTCIISDTQMYPGTVLNFTGYSQILRIDGTSNYWVEESNVLITGNPTIVVMGPEPSDLFPSKEIPGTVYTLVAEDAHKLLFTENGSDVTVHVPDNATVPFPVGTILYLSQQSFGFITLVEDGATTLLSRTTKQTAGTNSTIWMIQTQADVWVLGGDLEEVPDLSNMKLDALFGASTEDLIAISGTTTLSGPTYYRNVTPTGSAKIVTNGWPLYICGNLDLSNASAGAINWDGTDSTNNAADVASLTGGGMIGPTAVSSDIAPRGGAGGTAGGAGSISGSSSITQSTPSNGGATGPGGAGGTAAGGATAGGAGATTTGSISRRSFRSWFTEYLVWSGGTATPIKGASHGAGGGGGGGGGGGSPVGGHGGGGGGAAGPVVIYVRKIITGASTPAGVIRSKGGNASAATNGTSGTTNGSGGGGGGAGGGGGGVYVFCGERSGPTVANGIDSSSGTPTAGGNGTVGSSTNGAGGVGGGCSGGGEVLFIDYSSGTVRYAAPSATVAGSAASGTTGGAAATVVPNAVTL